MENFNITNPHITRNEVLQLLLRVSIASVITFYSVKWMMNQLDPTSKNKKKARQRAEEQLNRLRDYNDFKANVKSFSEYELMIASHLVVPSDITVGWSDIAGLDCVIQELRESVVLPIIHKELIQNSKLWQAPKGVLLHGPPGCGKTLIAKATAKEAGMRFINLDVALLTDKWYGESQKLASAVFSLALKIQPCIVFIDEIDSFLRSRSSNDHEATAMMKTQFMMLWDGLITNANATVIVMGATNRPQDLDKAILRRMPAQFHVALPSEEQRVQILKLILKSEEVESKVDYQKLGCLTNGFSGSDLREMCRNASVLRMRQIMLSNSVTLNEAESSDIVSFSTTRQLDDLKISMEDLLQSFKKMKETKMHADVQFFNNRIDLD